MKELQRNRGVLDVFSGKHAFITLRDLFRWAQRHPNSHQELAEEGFLLLAERLRKEEDKAFIQRTLEKHMKAHISVSALYSETPLLKSVICTMETSDTPTFSQIVWTPSMRRLFTLINKCLVNKVVSQRYFSVTLAGACFAHWCNRSC